MIGIYRNQSPFFNRLQNPFVINERRLGAS
jgi:hypothetical protein